MARKITYRHKRALAQGETIERGPRFPAMPESLQQPFLDGKILLIDKPLHWTSFDIIRKLRAMLQIKKIGHAGTLDPLASGLLLVCTGKCTKSINTLMGQPKTYTGTITLGATTPTYDLESDPIPVTSDFEGITERLDQVRAAFTGEILQRPPIYSAIKKEGIAAYELARRGTDVELEPRPITIYHIEFTRVALPELDFLVTCSTGTYIRSLAHDIGAMLGCGGYLSALRRTKIGDYRVEDATNVEQLAMELASQISVVESAKTDSSIQS